MQGLVNEVPFFICPFPPSEAVEMAKVGKRLINRLEKDGISVLKVNLYDLMIGILSNLQGDAWDRTLEIEPKVPKDRFREHLQDMVSVEDYLVPEIEKMVSETKPQVLIVSGVGEVFPIIRSHTVLNNLQKIAKDFPTVLFFPGEYIQSSSQGSSLKLFGILHDDNYYRAFDIFSHNVV